VTSSSENPLERAFAEATRLDAARDRAGAAAVLEAALDEAGEAGDAGPAHGSIPAGSRFKALLLRAELATDSGDLIGARGWLAEARQVHLNVEERGALSTESRRADDLETFLTHRGCAG
jgi:hypothetical protein